MTRPDFGSLFAPDSEANSDRDWHLTPRTAYALWDAARALHQRALDEIEEGGDLPVDPEHGDVWDVFRRYPPITWHQDRVWRLHAAASFADLAGDLAKGVRPMPENASEEMALWLIIEDAAERFDLLEQVDTLPEHADDLAWDECTDYLFYDHDILFLFDEGMVGVEDPEEPMHAIAPDIADYRPVAWFDPFWGGEPRRPDEPTYRDVLAARGGASPR